MQLLVWFAHYPLSILLSLGGGILMSGTAVRLLPPRSGRIRRFFPAILFFIAVQLPSWVGDENPLLLLPFFLLTFYLCYQASLTARLVTAMTLYTLIVPFNMMLDTAGRWERLDSESVLLVIIKCMLYVLVWLLVRRLTRNGRGLSMDDRLWMMCGLLLLAPLVAVLSFSLWGSFARLEVDTPQLQLAYTVLPFSMLSAAALLIALAVLSWQEELKGAAQLAAMRALYYQDLQGKETQVRMLRHDLRNHLSAISGLLEQGDTARAQSYIDDLCQSPALHGTRRICENEIANVVLTGKLEAMESRGIQSEILATLPEALPVADVDLCALLGNALDNAMEAATAAAQPRVVLRARADRGMLMLRVENSFRCAPVAHGGVFKTTKTDKMTHGFGIRGMQEIAERYGGTLETAVQGDRFELVAALPLAAEKQSLEMEKMKNP